MQKFFKNLTILLIIVSIPFSVYLLNQKTNFFGKASGVPANISIDVNNIVVGREESWRNLAQGGEEKGRQLLPVIEKVKVLRPKYIRIDHVFDFYSDTELDQVIQDITATGAKPFISLSYMPNNLAKDGDITSIPTDWGQWENLVQKTIEHISGTGGLNIKDVYYEVWNEPDLFGNFKTYGNKNYLDLYSHTVRAAMRTNSVQPFKIGGPATTAFYENWLNRLVVFTTENNLRLDFLSWHKYTKDLGEYDEDLISASHYQGKELIISEMGPNSENDEVYDNNFGAIHTIATAAALEGKIDKIFNFEIKDGAGPQKYWGRWGMLTHEKYGDPEIKPRYRAIQFLNNLIGGQTITVDGQGSWVKAISKRNGQKVQLLIVNYDALAKHAEAVPVRITNLPSNSFNLKRTDFEGPTTNQKITIENNVWETTLYLGVNSASLYTLDFDIK